MEGEGGRARCRPRGSCRASWTVMQTWNQKRHTGIREGGIALCALFSYCTSAKFQNLATFVISALFSKPPHPPRLITLWHNALQVLHSINPPLHGSTNNISIVLRSLSSILRQSSSVYCVMHTATCAQFRCLLCRTSTSLPITIHYLSSLKLRRSYLRSHVIVAEGCLE
jgi:hypothetical protein